MTTRQPLSSRVARLRELQRAPAAGAIPAAEPLPGDWPPGCRAYPASFAQARLWFLHQLEPDLTAYHLPALWRLSGPLEIPALEQALSDLVERHPTLRTSFRMEEGELVQLIHPPAAFALAAELLAERDAGQVIEAWLAQEASVPFDLTGGLLLRARLLRVSAGEHRLLLNHHHIASDGWSRTVLNRDLVELYNARRSGRAPQLPPLPIQYQDHAVWQRRRLSGSRLQELHNHWIPQFADLEPLELPADRPRPATPSHRGGRVALTIEPTLLAPLEKLCRGEGATLQMGLLALFALVLHRTSRQDDLAIGVPAWGRHHPGLEPLVGFFINTLPIRIRLASDLSFRQLLGQVRDTSLAAYNHQELPFERIVEALELERDPSRNPLVQAMLQLLELPAASLQGLEGVDAEALDCGGEAAKVDVFCVLRRGSGGGLSGSLGYATDLFDAERIERMAGHLRTLLAAVPAQPDVPVSRLGMLTRPERERIAGWQRGVIGGDHEDAALQPPPRPPRRPGRLRVCLIGDSILAVRCAEILRARGHELCLIVPTGRTLGQWAMDQGLPLLRVEPGALAAELGLCSPDLLLSVFNDRVLPAEVLTTAQRWAINFHDSLLPRHAGLHAPTWALLDGDTVHGVTWHLMTEGIDRGDVLLSQEFPVPDDGDALQLQLLCIEAGIASFPELLRGLEADRLQPRPIDPGVGRTYHGRTARPPRAGLLSLDEPPSRTRALVRALSVDGEQSPLPPPVLAIGTELVWIGQASRLGAGTSHGPRVQAQGEGLLLEGQGEAVVLRSLRSLWGDPLDAEALQQLVGAGEAGGAPALPAEQRGWIEALDREAARSEAFWIRQLERLRHTPPLALAAEGAERGRRRASLPLPAPLQGMTAGCERDGWLLALVAQAVAEVCGQPATVAALLHDDPRLQRLERPWSGLFSPWVPLALEPPAAVSSDPLEGLRQRAGAVAEQLEGVERHAPFRTDLIGRRQRLRQLRPAIAALPESLVVSRGRPAGEAGGEPAAALTVELPSGSGTPLRLSADRARLGPERWQALLLRLETLLRDAAAAAGRPAPAPPPATPTPEGAPAPLAAIRAIAAADPGRTALVEGARRISYGHLLDLASQLGEQIQLLAGADQPLVALVAERRSEVVLGMVACLLAERAFVVLDPQWPPARLRDGIEQLGGVPILAAVSCRAMVEPLVESGGEPLGFTLTDDLRLHLQPPPSPPEPRQRTPRPGWAGLAYVIFTSGSTGRPKAVGIERAALDAFAALMADVHRLDQRDRVLQFAALSFDACIEEIFPTLAAGATVCCRSDDSIATPARFLRFLERGGITVVSLPTAFWADLIQACWRDDLNLPACLRLVIVGGEALTVAHLRLWEAVRPPRVRLVNTYGPTEATVQVTLQDLERSWRHRHRVPIGRPLATAELLVLDPSGQPCPIGVPGELHIGGEGLARGYLNNPGLTAETFLPHPFSSDPTARLYRSGDLASWNPDGTLSFHGRIDQQIKLRGFRIEPGEIEAGLLAHPAVAQAAVVPRADHPSGPCLVAYWVPQAGAPATTEQLRAFLAERLPEPMVPAAFVALEALPLTRNGKIDRKALPAPSFSGAVQRRVEPSGDLERRLHALWAEVLGHADFGLTDSFFAIGGHSLAAARLIARIEQTLGTAPSLAGFFQAPTIAGLLPLLPAAGGAPGPTAAAAAIPRAEPLPGVGPPGTVAFPASFAQARLWFLQQLNPGLTAYHMPALWRLVGDLDVDALARALSALIERHPTLRTSFRMVDGELRQLLHPPVALPLNAEPLGDREAGQVIEKWLAQERGTPFDLGSGLLLRARLLAVHGQDHRLLLNHHHIASDGWSLSVLTRDLTELYNAHRAGRAPRLPPLALHYHDHAVWQRRRLSGRRLQELNAHWIARLSGLEPLELPTDHPRPLLASHRGASVPLAIDASRVAPFEALCLSEGATLQMGLVALLALLLQRLSRQEEFAIGVPIWGRSHPDLEPLIGVFINTLPLRVHVPSGLSFRRLLVQVRERSLAAYDHQELPFEQMVETLPLERDTSRNPLVQVMLQLLEGPGASLEALEGLQVEPLPVRDDAAKLDLSFTLRRSDDRGLQGRVVYASDLFERDRIERLGTHLLTLLSSVLQAPDAPADTLNLLPVAERQRIDSWQRGPDLAGPCLSLPRLFERQVACTPEAIALIFRGQSFTYAQLDTRVERLARRLTGLGVGPEGIVAVMLERSEALIVALLAILRAGGAFLPLDPSWPQARIQQLLEASGAGLVLANRPAPASGPPPAILTMNPEEGEREGGRDSCPARAPAGGGNLAYVLFTSGSTGAPKGVAIEHHALAHRCRSLAEALAIDGTTRILALTAAVFDISILEMLIPLAHGATVVLADEAERREPAAIRALIATHGVNLLQSTPSLLLALTEAGGLGREGLSIVAAGEPFPPVLSARLQAGVAQVFNAYGPTEATIWATVARLNGGDTPSIGRPLAGVRALILDPRGLPCPIGVPGELHLGGTGLARGYLHDAERTAAAFLPHPLPADPSGRLYRTGDLASWNRDGSLAFHGRIDHQIKLRGVRIEPGEIEARLLAHPAVAQAVVLLRGDDPAHPHLIGYWVRRSPLPAAAPSGEGAAPTPEGLRSFLAEVLPDALVPAALVELDALPLTTNGKLDRRALPAVSFSGELPGRVPPATALQRQLHALWAEVLGHSDFGIADNFFLMGGHSLAAARLAAAMATTFGRPLSVAAIFRMPTIAEQAERMLRVDGAEAAGGERCEVEERCLVTLQPMGRRPPLFVIHGRFGSVGHFIDLARALAPHRPVYGLQATARERGLPDDASVTTMAALYADQILRQCPEGRIHLLGASAGGWYAHAVAAALLERGARIGLFAVLDTHANARIHRRVGLRLVAGRLLPRLGTHLTGLLQPPGGEKRSAYLLGRLQALNHHLERILHRRLPLPAPGRGRSAPGQGDPGTGDRVVPVPGDPDPFIALLEQSYRPPRLPIAADLLAPPAHLEALDCLWRFYARGGVRRQPLFDTHQDFFRPERMQQLADVLEVALGRVDAEAAAAGDRSTD